MPEASSRWEPAQEVLLVEHDDKSRRPKPGGEVMHAVINRVTGLYVRAICLDGSAAGIAFTVWASSGWHAWDGWFRWRLMTQEELDAALAAEGSGS